MSEIVDRVCLFVERNTVEDREEFVSLLYL